MFKQKPEKKYLTGTSTLDTIHKKKVNEFDSRRKNLEKLQFDLKKYENELIKINTSTNDFDISSIKTRSMLKDKIDKISQEIYDIKYNVSELDYYSKADDILFEYYADSKISIDTEEQKEELPNKPEKTKPKKIMKTVNNTNNGTSLFDINFDKYDNSYIINEIIETNKLRNADEMNFKKSLQRLEKLNVKYQANKKYKKVTKRRMRKIDNPNQKNILDYVHGRDSSGAILNQITTITNKATLFNNYMAIFNNTGIETENKHNRDICENCKTEKTIMRTEGRIVCDSCGEIEYIAIESEIPSHKDSINEKQRYPYKRMNHLTE